MAKFPHRACFFSWQAAANFACSVCWLDIRPVLLVHRSPTVTPSLRAAVISEWRGLPQRTIQRERWQSSADLMPKLMQRLGLRERLREAEVIDAWSKIVGDFISAHSSPVALREGVLFVRVLQPA